MVTKDFRQGAEMVGKAAEAKFNNIGNSLNELRGQFSEYADQQAVINQAIINRSDDHEERMRQLEENRYFVRSSRRGIEDLDMMQQDRLVGWLQKLVREFNIRGFSVNSNQQKFLGNILQFLGITDEVVEVSDLSMMENFGNSEIHEIVYKIFLIFAYLYDNSFDILKHFEDVSALFKLSDKNKVDIQKLLAEERIPLLGLDGLVNLYDSSRALNSFKPQRLYASVREIHTHPLLQVNASDDVKKLYIQGFALLTEGCGFNDAQYDYLKSLANVLQCASALEDIDQLCVMPQKFQVGKWVAVLDDDMMKYSWLLDGIMLLCQLPEVSRDTVKTDTLEEGAKALRLMQVKEFISAAIALCLAESATDLYGAIAGISYKTGGWEHILEYRNLNVRGAFNDIIKKLTVLSIGDILVLSAKSLSLRIEKPDLTYSDFSEFDNSVFDKMKTKMTCRLLETKRSLYEKKITEYANEVKSLIDNNIHLIREANTIFTVFNMHRFYPSSSIDKPEINKSCLNEDWPDECDTYFDNIDNALTCYDNTLSDIISQLKLIEKGQYHTSVVEMKKAEEEKRKELQRAERESKKNLEIATADGTYTVSMSWKNLDDVPFAVEDIKSIGYAGGNWFVIAAKPYYCDSNCNWHMIPDLTQNSIWKTFQINGYLVLTTYTGKMWFSSDCRNWKEIYLPTEEDIIDIIYYQGKYILYTLSRTTYTYTEEGFIFDSEKEDYYDATAAWVSSSLGGDWERWDAASYINDGMILTSNIACNENIIVGRFKYDYCYKKNKKKQLDNEKVLYFINSRWREATWPKDINLTGGKIYFLNNHGIYVCGSILLSEKGYEWNVVEDMWCYEPGGLCGNVFITKPDSNGKSLISLDGLTIRQMVVSEEGRWEDAFGFGDGQVLGVYAKSRHESILRLGTLNVVRQ